MLGMGVPLAAALGLWWSTNSVELEDHPFPSPALVKALGEGARIVHLTDLHLTGMGGRERRALDAVREARPDLILLTGDLLDVADPSALQAFLAELKAPLGVIAITGDADRSGRMEAISAAFEASDARLIDGRSVLVGAGSGRSGVHIIGASAQIGVDGLVESLPDDGAPAILLMHDVEPALKPREAALHISTATAVGEVYRQWRWRGDAAWSGTPRQVRFAADGRHLMRVQRAQHGLLIDEIRLTPVGATGEPILLHHGNASDAVLQGTYEWRESWGTPHGHVLADWPAGDEVDVLAPLPLPARFAELWFEAPADVAYRVEARVRCHGAQGHGSAWIQFGDAVDESGQPLYRIGRIVRTTTTGRVALVLSGDTHGGQVWVPGITPALAGAETRLWRGMHRIDDAWVHVSRGIGTSHVPIRWWSRPEVALLRATSP